MMKNVRLIIHFFSIVFLLIFAFLALVMLLEVSDIIIGLSRGVSNKAEEYERYRYTHSHILKISFMAIVSCIAVVIGYKSIVSEFAKKFYSVIFFILCIIVLFMLINGINSWAKTGYDHF
jgi:hypothetical protein